MKITMYELMGLVKDGKAPSKIKYIDKIYSYYNSDYRFWDDEYELYGYLTSYIGNNSFDVLNDEVEIMEEEKAEITEEQIESFKEQFNYVWNSIMAVLGGILEALQVIDKEALTKKVLKKTNKIEKLDIWNRYTNHKNLHTYMQLIDDKDDKEKTFCISTVQKEIIVKLNEVIDAINERGEKNDK